MAEKQSGYAGVRAARRRFRSTAAAAVVHALHLGEPVDVCVLCGCAEYSPCPNGCAWANRERTLCTACLDKRFRIVPSRRSGFVSLIDNRSQYRRLFASPREAARAAVALTLKEGAPRER